VKENKCKKKKKYDWCVSREKNIEVVWGVAGKSGHDGVYHCIRPQHLASTSATWWTMMTAPMTSGCSFTCPPTSASNRHSASSYDASWRRESLMWEKSREFEQLSGGKYFRRFFYQEESFNFLYFSRKFKKIHIFSYLKFCFKISRI